MAEAAEKAEAMKEARASMAQQPFRFFMAPGDDREIVIVDDEPNFFRYEHNLQNPENGRWDIYTACLNEHTNCPVCSASTRAPYFAMYLTILDLTPYETRDHETVEWSKKLLVVKPAQQKKIMRLFETHGSLRGMVLRMARDGDKDASIGNDIEFIEFLEEDQLAEYLTEYEDREGKVHEVDGSVAFDYDELFPMPTEEMLEGLVGGGSRSAGSRSGDRRDLNRDNRSSRGSRGSAPARGRERAAPADDWDEPRAPARRGRGGDDAPADEAPRGRRSAVAPARREAPAPAARRAPRRAEPEDQDQGGDDQGYDDQQPEAPPAPRRGAPAQGRRPAAPPARRGAQAQDEGGADDAPQRGGNAASMAARRSALRR